MSKKEKEISFLRLILRKLILKLIKGELHQLNKRNIFRLRKNIQKKLMKVIKEKSEFFYKQKLILYCFYPSLLGQFMKNQDY